MKKCKSENENKIVVFMVIADIRRKKLLLPEGTVKKLNDLNCDSTRMYFQYKRRYPDFGEEIIPDIEPISLKNEFLLERGCQYEVV